MKLILNVFVILLVTLPQLTLAREKPDSLIKVDEKKSVSAEYNQKKSRGIQQQINLSFVHHYADFFRSNEMESHLNLGYCIKPKLKHFEVVASFSYTKTRIEDGSQLHDEYNDKWLLISMLDISYSIPD